MREHDPKIDVLRRVPELESARVRELRAIAAAGDLTRADAGRVLLRADRRAIEAYLIIEGEVDVVIGGRAIARLGAGEIVGELAIIDGEPRTADVVAATDVTLLAIHATGFRALIEDSHAIRMLVFRQLAARLRRMDLADLDDDLEPLSA
jgi:CPA1 family monovalent cation:H+ antiporter